MRFSKLNKNAIKLIGANQRIVEHGVEVQRTASGDLKWSVAIMVDGQRIHRVIGRASEGVTREQAERAIESFRTKAREGRLDLPTGRKNHRSFAEAASEYLVKMEENGGKNMKAKRQHVDKLLIPFFGKHRADRISALHVQEYARGRLSTGLKQATVNRELATLSHLMRRIGIKPEDRPEFIKGNEPRKAIVVLSDDHATAFMKAAIADQDERLWLFVAFGLNTAMRHSQILRVRYDQIDFDSRRIFISQAKAGEREQPITAALIGMLRKQREMENDADKDGYVFPSRVARAKHPHRISMAASFQRAVIRAGLLPEKVTPHVMRHTAITRLVKAGVDLPTIQKISGHKTLVMVLRYVHIHGKHIDEAIAAIDTGFGGTITPELHTPSTATSEREVAVGH